MSMSPKLFFSYFSLNSFMGVSFIYSGFTAVVNSSGFAAHGENRLQLYYWNTEKFKASFDLGQNRRNFDLFPIPLKSIRQNGVFWHPRGFAAGGMLWRFHFMLPKFSAFL